MGWMDRQARMNKRGSRPEIESGKRRGGQGPEINAAQVLAASAMLVGMSVRWWGDSDPSESFMVEDGRLLSQAEYPEAYAVLGTTHNLPGDPAGSFRIPDSRDRTGVGASPTKPVGAKFGSEFHVLTLPEIPTHDHAGTAPTTVTHDHGGATSGVDLLHAHGGVTGSVDLTHNHTGLTGTDSHFHGGSTAGADLTHNHGVRPYALSDNRFTDVTLQRGGTTPVVHSNNYDGSLTGGSLDIHSHGIPSNTHGHSIPASLDLHGHSIAATLGIHAHLINAATTQHSHPINPQGGNGAHNNMQPSIAVNYAIRVLP